MHRLFLRLDFKLAKCDVGRLFLGCDPCRLLQVALHDNEDFLGEVDKLASPQTATEATVVQCYHSWVGNAFMSWIDREPAALSKHIQVLRDAAKLEIFLIGILQKHGITVQVHAPLQTNPVGSTCTSIVSTRNLGYVADVLVAVLESMNACGCDHMLVCCRDGQEQRSSGWWWTLG